VTSGEFPDRRDSARERVVEKDFRAVQIDLVLSGHKAMGGQGGVRGRRHRVPPRSTLSRHNRLERDGVHVQTRNAPVPTVKQTVESPHLAQDVGHVRVRVREHRYLSVAQEAEQVGQFLLVHAERIDVRDHVTRQHANHVWFDKGRALEVDQNALAVHFRHETPQGQEVRQPFV